MARLVRTLAVGFALMALTYVAAIAGDWLTVGGDPQHSGWQRYGKRLTPATAGNLALLWKHPFASPPSSALILGPTITHRGVRELVFVQTASGDIYAFDADFGTVFWKRSFAAPRPASSCAGVEPLPAAIQPDPDDDEGEPVADEDDHDDEPDAMRPVYLVDGDGILHAIRPSDGADITTPVDFLPAGAIASNLNFGLDRVYATVRNGCSGNRRSIWALEVRTREAKPVSFPADGSGPADGVSVGFGHVLYGTTGNRVVALNPENMQVERSAAAEAVTFAPVVFKWRYRSLIAAANERELFLLDEHLRRLAAAGGSGGDEFTGRIASWEDPAGARWIYAAAQQSIVAFQVKGPVERPNIERVWRTGDIGAPSRPVVTHGVVLTLSEESGHGKLVALDAATGRVLYTSGNTIASTGNSPELALANGHVCFTSSDKTLYCFGIPIER